MRAATRVRYGYRRIPILLRREGWEINHKRTHRRYRELGLQLRNKTPKRKVKAKLRGDRTPATAPNACWSMRQVDWRARGFDGRVLGYLLLQHGYYHCGHRASADVDALIQMLRHECPGGRTALPEMIDTGSRPTWIVRARGAHFDVKDQLRARGYRWTRRSTGRSGGARSPMTTW
jgi:hypothetical protein